MVWTEESIGGGGRWGLLIIADEHAADPTMDVAEGARARDLLSQALGAGLGIVGSRLRVLAGEKVTEPAVDRELARLGRLVRGDDNSLLVYYLGHAWTNGGALELFTHDTTREGDSFTRTLPYARLTALLGRTRQKVQEAGGALKLLTVVDACRPRTKAPPGPAKYTPTDLDVELFAASKGQLASEGVFVETFCQALLDHGKREQTRLGDLFDQTKAGVLERTRGAQEPSLDRGDLKLVLRDASDLALSLDVWDPLGNGKRLVGATVSFGARKAVSPAGLRGLRPGRYAWQAEAPGYLWRTGEVELRRERSGRTLRIDLLPQFVLVTGEVVNPHGTVVRVRLDGTRPEGTIDGYHALETTVTGTGSFTLRPPIVPSDVDVVLEAAGSVVARLPLSLAAADYVVAGDVRVPRRHLGSVDLGALGAADSIEDLAPITSSGGALPALVFQNQRDRVTYDTAVRLPAARGGTGFREALAALEPLAARVAETSRRDLAELRATLTIEAAAVTHQSAPDRGRKDLSVLLESSPADAPWRGRAVGQLVRWLVEDGHAALERDEPAGVRLLDQALAAAPEGELATVVQAERTRGWVRWVEAAIQKALKDDGWQAAQSRLAAAASALGEAGAKALEPLRATLEREGMPRVARDDLTRAHAAYAAGQLEEAESLYEQVRPRCNAFHEAVVARQLEDLGTRILGRLLSKADERRAAGDLGGAAAALLRARRYDPEVADTLLDRLPAEALPPPMVVLEAPGDGAWSGPEIQIAGRVEAVVRTSERLRLFVGGDELTIAADGSFKGAARLADGTHTITIRAEVGVRRGHAQGLVHVDARAPTIGQILPRDRATSTQARIDVSAEITDAAPWVEVTLTGPGGPSQKRVERGERFAGVVELQPGANDLELAAIDPFGNRTSVRWRVTRAEALPIWWDRIAEQDRPALPLSKWVLQLAEPPPAWVFALETAPPMWALTRKEKPPAWALGLAEEPPAWTLRLTSVPAWALKRSPRSWRRLPDGVVFAEQEDEYRLERAGVRLVWVERATYTRGSDQQLGSDDAPAHEVRLTRGFFFGVTEVTWRQYRAFCEATRRPLPRGETPDDHPVTRVTHADAEAFSVWAGGRLPTEAEWELAARGSDGRAFPWGDELLVQGAPAANVHGSVDGVADRFARTAPVGSFPAGASPCGALDLSGNVAEWVQDWFDAYAPAAAVDPVGPAAGKYRVVRGGSWSDDLRRCRATVRLSRAPDSALEYVGFRVAVSAP